MMERHRRAARQQLSRGVDIAFCPDCTEQPYQVWRAGWKPELVSFHDNYAAARAAAAALLSGVRWASGV